MEQEKFMYPSGGNTSLAMSTTTLGYSQSEDEIAVVQ